MSDACSFGFEDPFAQATVGIDAVFILIFGVILITWFTIRMINLKEKSILKWYFYGFSVVFAFLSTVLDLAFETLNVCDVFSFPTFLEAEIAVLWLGWISSILLLAAVMISLSGAMYKTAKPGSAGLVYGVGGAVVGFVTIIMIAYCAVASRYNSTVDDTGVSFVVSSDTLNSIHLALEVFYFLASLLAIAELIALLVMMHGKVSTGALTILIPLLCLMLFGNSIIGLIEVARAKDGVFDTFAGYVCDILFSDFFQASIYLLLIFIGESGAIKAGINTNNAQFGNEYAGAYPGGPGMIQQEQPPQGYQQGVPVMYAYAPQPGMQPQYGQPMPVYAQQGQQPQLGMNGHPLSQQPYQAAPPEQQYQAQQTQYPTGAGPASRMVGSAADSAGNVSPEMAAPQPVVGQRSVEPEGVRTVSPPAKGSELP